MSSDRRPKLVPGVVLTSLQLTPAEGFAVSRIDGRTTEHELSLLTGLPADGVRALLERLEAEGVVEAEAPAEVPEPPDAVDESGAVGLKLYREKFHGLPEGERSEAAATASGALLSALCYDPLPSVIRRVLENPNCAVEQARLIAAHHSTATGLDQLLSRGDLARDAEVQRKLWRNPQLGEGQVRRLTASKRLLEVWKLTVSRESTAQTRSAVMKVLRGKFPSASAEERVELILTTEGRCLAGLSGLPIDGRTTALLCGRTFSSVLLIQNISNWAAAPPALIAHLLKQPLVMRQQQLRKKLELHPNAPSGAR